MEFISDLSRAPPEPEEIAFERTSPRLARQGREHLDFPDDVAARRQHRDPRPKNSYLIASEPDYFHDSRAEQPQSAAMGRLTVDARPFSLEGQPRSRHYIQRDAETAELKAYFIQQGQSMPRQRTFVLHGMGGKGKSTLCKEFASKHRKSFSAVLWVDGSSLESLFNSLARIARRYPDIVVVGEFSTILIGSSGEAQDTRPQFDYEEAGRKLLAWLSEEENTGWLFILDNVDRSWQTANDPQAYEYRRYIPYADHGNILITTRLQFLSHEGDSMRLDKMSQNQAREVLLSYAERRLEDTDELLRELDVLPLALAHAGSYLSRNTMSVLKYLDKYHATFISLTNSQWKSTFDKSQRSIATCGIHTYIHRLICAALRYVQLFWRAGSTPWKKEEERSKISHQQCLHVNLIRNLMNASLGLASNECYPIRNAMLSPPRSSNNDHSSTPRWLSPCP
ncbi:hypothetical protein AC579_7107 [Pseudocercospora musae]|uniref:Uncharacterized protein n=1 Tax=Pseudocercospora musae TaxID=113226 RepID=A0A139INE5_9PEZI|nr:hypothetical protein AC579_7107 [Pseudocercospora musae]